MEIEQANCECCGLREDCTQQYIASVKADFNGAWLCGLCSEAVRYEMARAPQQQKKKKARGGGGVNVDEAMRAHMSFCRKTKMAPNDRVADDLRQMLQRRSSDLSRSPSGRSSSRRFGRSASSLQVCAVDESSLSCIN